MSAKDTAWLDAGLICCGLMRGITFSVRHITRMIAVKNTNISTGCHSSAQFWISAITEVPAPELAGTGLTSGVGASC